MSAKKGQLPGGALAISARNWIIGQDLVLAGDSAGRNGILRPMKLILKWLFSAAALLAVAYLYSGVTVTSFTSALVAAAVLAALNAVVRPVLVLLTLPVTLVTLGLFLFVINALMFWAAASLLSGLQVTGFVAALIGSLIYSALQLAIEFLLERLLPK